jgi:hypothetical protein
VPFRYPAKLLRLGFVACISMRAPAPESAAAVLPKIRTDFPARLLLGPVLCIRPPDPGTWYRERAIGSCTNRCFGDGHAEVVGVDGGTCRFEDLDRATQEAIRAPLSCLSGHVADGGLLQWNAGDCAWSCMDQDDPRAGSGYVVAGNLVSATLADGGACPYADVSRGAGDFPSQLLPPGSRGSKVRRKSPLHPQSAPR